MYYWLSVLCCPVDQIAQALQDGAAGVLLIAAAVGGDLEALLNACTIMGTEALVEVHTPNELEFALSRGATLFLVNMWDRMSGQLFTEQVTEYAGCFLVIPVWFCKYLRYLVYRVTYDVQTA
jgi:hypothetical protein